MAGNADGGTNKGLGGGGKTKALVVGINNYASPNQLPSCVNDAETSPLCSRMTSSLMRSLSD